MSSNADLEQSSWSFWDLMRALPCIDCGAEADEPCRTQSGDSTNVLHRARYDAAKQLLRGS